MSAALSYSATARENSNIDVLVSNVSNTIKSDFSGWDFSSVKSNNCFAWIIFTIEDNGALSIENIISNDKEFKQVVISNFSKISVIAPEAGHRIFFKVVLKHKRI